MLDSKYIELIRKENTMVYSDEPMDKHTSFRIGGNADCLCEVKDTVSLKNIIRLCRENSIPYFILGLGSNILVSDKGIDGLVRWQDFVYLQGACRWEDLNLRGVFQVL